MEYFWYVLSALFAGIGTGLAGVSSATVLVPILIVLCPSFAGEMGAYQATAIALASDILSSAVATGVYIRNKRIDLRRGWVMMACILCTCVAGSVVAYRAGNVVVGGFSLFLTFFIGIRFLIKPDSQRADAGEIGSKLGVKDLIISLFFGLTIGFGTGFVGTGGGMMMMIVFTAFLGMELKTAVGTSTFIMAFTAVLASVSHILLEPSILLERWDVLAICVVVTTLASLVSARFANRVKNKTIGLITGVALTILGAAMLILNYWSVLSQSVLLLQVLRCSGEFLEYIVIGAVSLLVLRRFCKTPHYIFRKLLHLVAFSSAVAIVMIADSWIAASIAAVLFAAIVYPVLRLVENRPWFDGLFVQKQRGEIKLSLILLFVTVAAVIALAWGAFGERYLAATAILMWGVGDAAAAIVGTRRGKHIVHFRLADGKKTWEGSTAMFLAALLCGVFSLHLLSALPWDRSLLLALPSAIIAAFVELISHKGNDTVTVPAAVTAGLILLSLI